MSGKIIQFHKIQDRLSEQVDSKDTKLIQTKNSFVHAIDYCLLGLNELGYQYISQLIEGIYQNIIENNHFGTNSDFMLRIEFQLQSCNIFECKFLLRQIDRYLENMQVQASSELDFYKTLRNVVFYKHEEIINRFKK
ncbi:hypothetical protein GW846_01410 [Candidatus Gracilibacteria bacterium]|nr:hypothetical protein [Candidatus Gracilibacteria bacterium]